MDRNVQKNRFSRKNRKQKDVPWNKFDKVWVRLLTIVYGKQQVQNTLSHRIDTEIHPVLFSAVSFTAA